MIEEMAMLDLLAREGEGGVGTRADEGRVISAGVESRYERWAEGA